MAKLFEDFTFNNKRFSDLGTSYISTCIDNSDENNLAMQRDGIIGSTNQYRTEPNYFGSEWKTTLTFELHIMKNPCLYQSREELEITKTEIREITRWLTSPHLPMWITFTNKQGNNDDKVKYKGYFNDIQAVTVGKSVVFLKLFFTCTTPFAYTEDKTVQITANNTYQDITIENNSDELYDYAYPMIHIYPTGNTDCAIINTTDSQILAQGKLNGSSNYLLSLVNEVDSYANLKRYNVRYNFANQENETLITYCNNSLIEFTYIDYSNNELKCCAYYDPLSHNFYIIQGGVMHFKLYTDLNLHIDCKNLLIYDDLERMVTYDQLGVQDVDAIYWFRLFNGENNIKVFSSNSTIAITYNESRKVGE